MNFLLFLTKDSTPKGRIESRRRNVVPRPIVYPEGVDVPHDTQSTMIILFHDFEQSLSVLSLRNLLYT